MKSTVTVPCEFCDGTGEIRVAAGVRMPVNCGHCHGSGHVERDRSTQDTEQNYSVVQDTPQPERTAGAEFSLRATLEPSATHSDAPRQILANGTPCA